MAERIDDPAEQPAVLLGDRGELGRTGGDGAGVQGHRILGDEQRPSGRAGDLPGIKALHARVGRGHPEAGIADGQLGDDVVAVTDEMQRRPPRTPPRRTQPRRRRDRSKVAVRCWSSGNGTAVI